MEFLINPAKTCALTGHRVIGKDLNKIKIKNNLKELIKQGYDTFLCGMAIGFDLECFKILVKLKQKNDIKLIACIPCENQSERYNKQQKEEYDTLLEIADQKIYVSKEYTNNCMLKRNRYMVDRCSVVLAYLRRDFGGTASTVNYANKLQKKVIII